MDEFELRSEDSRLRIATLGAECKRWSVSDRDVLWSLDPCFWDATSPLLFPVCGWTRNGEARVGGRVYPLGLHGFARASQFRVEQACGNCARLVLKDDATTRAVYPFAFELTVSYQLGPTSLEIIGEVRNRGRVPMPYAFGLHPGFRRDPAAPARIRFEAEEQADVPVIAPGGLFSSQRRPIALTGRDLIITPETFAAEALCFVPAASRGLVFEQEGGPSLRVEFPGFDNLVLWSKPGAPFLCIEPWTGHGDPEGFAGDLYEKPGMKLLPAGASSQHRALFSLLA